LPGYYGVWLKWRSGILDAARGGFLGAVLALFFVTLSGAHAATLQLAPYKDALFAYPAEL
jgi:hypothetical protein